MKQDWQTLANMLPVPVVQGNQAQSQGRALEFWPPNEPGAPNMPRPQSLPMGQPGIENFSGRPQDVVGDYVSHWGVNNDKQLSNYYSRFKNSLNIDQQQRLVDQYGYSKQNFGEKRPYPKWEQDSGMPAYFRGYAFDQWDNPDKLYTPDQTSMFDAMVKYLGR